MIRELSSPLRQRLSRPAAVGLVAVTVVVGVWAVAPLFGWNEDTVASWVPESGLVAGLIIIALLIADTALPIPGSVLMMTSGALLGPWVGSLVNGLGLILAAAVGYLAGSVFGFGASPNRDDRPAPQWTVAITRGVPVLSESVALSAGALAMPFGAFARSAAIGSVAVGAVYGVAGAFFDSHWALVPIALVAVVACQVALQQLSARSVPAIG